VLKGEGRVFSSKEKLRAVVERRRGEKKKEDDERQVGIRRRKALLFNQDFPDREILEGKGRLHWPPEPRGR